MTKFASAHNPFASAPLPSRSNHTSDKRATIKAHFFRIPCASWPPEQHLKLLEASFAAFALCFEAYLALFQMSVPVIAGMSSAQKSLALRATLSRTHN